MIVCKNISYVTLSPQGTIRREMVQVPYDDRDPYLNVYIVHCSNLNLSLKANIPDNIPVAWENIKIDLREPEHTFFCDKCGVTVFINIREEILFGKS